MQSRSLIFLLVVAALAGLSIFGYLKKDYAYGLDVKGGMRLIYQVDPESLSAEQEEQLPRIQSDLVRIMTDRAASNLGVVESAVQPKGTDQIIVELPGFTNEDEAKETMSSTAKIIVYHAKNVETPDPTAIKLYRKEGSETIGGAPVEMFSRISNPNLKLTPVKLEGMTDEEFERAREGYQQMIEGWDVILEGAEVSDAKVLVQGNYTQPQFFFSSEGSRKMEDWSRKWSARQENIAFVLDGRVLNIAPLKQGVILSDSAYIDGEFDGDYTRSLTQLIKAGSLPVDLELISSQSVDPTIGSKALDQIVQAGLISFGAICLFLLVYYAFPGVIAAVAMCLYALFTITVMKYINATFSLAAIAALILSVGMAVDANVLVFERIKEELKNGRELRKAISIGFSRALSAIFDSNAATILTSIVLASLGTGPVKGFATALIIGVLVSFFTAFFITRALLEGLITMGIGTNTNWYGLKRNWFGEKLEQDADSKPLDIVGKAKKYFLISGAIIAVGMIFVFMGGIKPNVEFQGGYEGEYKVPAGQTVTTASIREKLQAADYTGANVKLASVDGQQVVYVTVPMDSDINPETARDDIANAISLPSEDSSFTEVGPTIAKETLKNAILGIIISALLIIFYLAIRFGFALGGMKNGLKFGMCAVGALVHDVLVVMGTAGIVGMALGWEVSALFITAMLTVIGFSVHDTIVIFDRIRENLRRVHTGETFEHLVNRSITQSIARSINTSFTAVIPLAILIAIGTPTPELKFMCLAMLVGITVGTYSSIFNASPLLWLWNKATMKRHGEDAGLMAEATRETQARARAAAQQMQAAPEPGSAYGTIKRRKGVEGQATHKVDEDED